MLKYFDKIKIALLAICLFGDGVANASEMLIVGCRPWNDNVMGVEGITKAHFVDYVNRKQQSETPPTFHYLDLNDEERNKAGKFSKFAEENPGKFDALIVDWNTYHHITRDTAYVDFFKLLKSGGQLILPVLTALKGGAESASKQVASILILKMKIADVQFRDYRLVGYDDLLNGACWAIDEQNTVYLNFLRRNGGGFEQRLENQKPVVIVATK